MRIALAQQGKAYLTSSVTLRSDLYIPQDAELNIYEGRKLRNNADSSGGRDRA